MQKHFITPLTIHFLTASDTAAVLLHRLRISFERPIIVKKKEASL